MTTGARRPLTWLVWFTTAAILVQAVLAGQFISGLNPLLPIHAAVGNVLELSGVALLLWTPWVRSLRRNHRRLWLAALFLGFGLFVQAAMGYAPGSVPTAIHIPLGVVLLAGSLQLSIGMSRATYPAPG
jgi:hypothetical protein